MMSPEERYANAALDHWAVPDADDANLAASRIRAALDEMIERGEARQALKRLMKHPAPEVRGWAASHSLGFAPRAARRVLAAIDREDSGLLGLNAKATIEEWEKGRLRPPRI